MIVLHNDFKTIQFALFFVDVDDKKYAVHRFMLPKLMSATTKSYPTRQKLNQKMEELYGAYIKVRTERMANLSVMSLVLTCVDPNIVKDDSLLDQALALFHEVIEEERIFNEDVFNDEKRMLIEQWETLKDKKRAYAREQFLHHFFGDDLYAYPISGTLRDIKKLKLEDVESYYKDMITNQVKYIVINGRTDQLDLGHIESMLGKTKALNIPFVTTFREPREVTYVTENTKMQQAIVRMGYILKIYRHDKLYDAAVLLDTILGGYPESRLFKIIREQEGLCYDIASGYDYYKGVMMISSGIDVSKLDHALKQIEALVEQLKNEGITELELTHAKAYYIHQLKTSLDSQSTLTKRAFVRDMLHYHESVEDKISLIQRVTLDDVNQAAKMLVYDTCYVLKGEDHD